MVAASAPQFVLVKHASPRDSFRRAGLSFSRSWRALQVSDTKDLEKGIIDPETLAILEAEPMLAVKPATADELATFREQLASSAGKDKDTLITELQQANANLEARLMKLELAASGGGKVDKKDDAKSDKKS